MIFLTFFHWLVREETMTPTELKRLAAHKYNALNSSILDDLCMQKFWNWLVEKYPIWLAPNAITLIGLTVNITAVFILAWHSFDGKQDVIIFCNLVLMIKNGLFQAPWWVYLLCAIGLFVYQALDATDGKQARRTGSASPLGELFDHGCDSLSQGISAKSDEIALYISTT
jgi:hypothetical protein